MAKNKQKNQANMRSLATPPSTITTGTKAMEKLNRRLVKRSIKFRNAIKKQEKKLHKAVRHNLVLDEKANATLETMKNDCQRMMATLSALSLKTENSTNV